MYGTPGGILSVFSGAVRYSDLAIGMRGLFQSSRRGASEKRAQSRFQFSVGINRGTRRALLCCSKANAIFNKIGSLQARPKNEMPTGSPRVSPAGTVMF